MSLLRDVVAVLQAEGIAHALIGAAAMAVHGVSRATADVDLRPLTKEPCGRSCGRGSRRRG